jgi:tetratricopeptide (TPR) repeat protein
MRLPKLLLTALCLAASWANCASALTPERTHQLQQQALDHFYSLEYTDAIRLFEQLRDAEPANAAWQNQTAMSYFYELLYRAGALQGDLFGASNRFFRTKKFTPDPVLAERFHQANNAAIRLCETRLQQDRNDEAALYACGVAYAARATYQGLIERSLFAALGSARQANEFHSRLIRRNPKFYDAYLIPGIYDYVIGSLPRTARFLLFFGGVTGNKLRGIGKVEIVAKSGEMARQDARILLTVMYRREKRYGDALTTMHLLAEAYPRNYIFPLEIASLHRGAGEIDQAISHYEQVLELVREGAAGFERAPTARIHFELGDLYRQANNIDAAVRHLRQVSGAQGSSPELNQEAEALIEKLSRTIPPPTNGASAGGTAFPAQLPHSALAPAAGIPALS